MSVESVITRHLPGWPQGDPGALRSAADCWTSVTSGLHSSIEDARVRISSLSGSWQGDGKTAFEQEWTKLATAVSDACDEMGNVATSLNQAAGKLENAQHAYEVAVSAAAVTVVVGLALTVVSFGTSDAAAGAAVEAEVAVAVELAAEATSAASIALSAAASIAEQIVTRFVVLFGVDLTTQAAVGAIVYPDHNPLAHLNIESAVTVAGAVTLMKLPGGSGLAARMLASGVKAAAGSAAFQETTTGKIDPGRVLFTGAVGAAGAGVMIGGAQVFSRFAAGAEKAAGDGAALDLQAEEDAVGHTIAEHVGISNDALIARNLPQASTFTDISAATTATADNIAANQALISRWLAGTSPRLAIQNTMNPSDGIVYVRATQSFVSPSIVNTVLVRSSTGWNVLTSYPMP